MKSVIYIPGLGDEKLLALQRKIIKRWDNKHIETAFFESNWHSNEDYLAKFKRLQEFLDKQPHEEVMTVGSSAGASLALTLFAENQPRVTQTRLICGKFQSPELIGPEFRRRAPALVEAATKSEAALKNLSIEELGRVQSYRSLFDEVIRVSEMKVAGAKNHLMPVVGHSTGIGLGLFVVARPRS